MAVEWKGWGVPELAAGAVLVDRRGHREDHVSFAHKGFQKQGVGKRSDLFSG